MSLSEQDRAELQAVLRSEVYDGSVSSRAQIVLWHDEGRRKGEIAKMSGASRPTVDKWLARYEKFGMDGLVSQTSPGGPRQIPDRIRARVLALTRTSPPAALGISHWSSTEMARYIKKTEGVYVSQTWVSRLWRDNDLQPWRQGTFKISKDPRFEEKVRDVAGLYLNPPEGGGRGAGGREVGDPGAGPHAAAAADRLWQDTEAHLRLRADGDHPARCSPSTVCPWV